MVHMGLVGQYFSELDPNYDGPPRAADPAVQARKLVSSLSRKLRTICSSSTLTLLFCNVMYIYYIFSATLCICCFMI